MAEIKQFKPSTKESPKPEKPADVVDIESARKKRQLKESPDTSSILSDALELVQEGQLTNEEIDNLRMISEKEKKLLKKLSDQLEELGNKGKEIEDLQRRLREFAQELAENKK